MSTVSHRYVSVSSIQSPKKLLQLDRRNNLLYFKPGRAIEIVNATVDGLTEQLVASRNGLSFDFVEPPRRGGRGSFSLDDDVDEEEEAEPVVIPGDIDTQGIEGFWSRLKRQLYGTHHHVQAGFLGMYVDEAAFKHNTRALTDRDRFAEAMRLSPGQRLSWFSSEGESRPAP